MTLRAHLRLLSRVRSHSFMNATLDSDSKHVKVIQGHLAPI